MKMLHSLNTGVLPVNSVLARRFVVRLFLWSAGLALVATDPDVSARDNHPETFPPLVKGIAAGGQRDIGSFLLSATPTPTPKSGQPLNISTRLQVLKGDNVLIAGFIVTGTAPKKIIARAIGPSLKNAGVANALADPVLELNSGAATLFSNDNWRDNSAQAAQIQATGIPPKNDLESAIVATLAPGAYTAVVAGKNGSTGVAVAEVYDLDQTVDSQLANISTRGFVDVNDNVMIGGFIIGANNAQATRVLVRAIGPSLPVAGALQDPTLELHDGNGTTLASNDNWKDTQQANIQLTGAPPLSDLESAVVQTLLPGAYTAIVRGKGATTGVALIEVYNLTKDLQVASASDSAPMPLTPITLNVTGLDPTSPASVKFSNSTGFSVTEQILRIKKGRWRGGGRSTVH
jgi:hypothetical protein